MPRIGAARGLADRCDYRQPERQECRKRGRCIDAHGFDAGKKIKGKKRHLLVDTQGLVLHAIVHSAALQDRDGGMLVMATLFGLYPLPAEALRRWRISGPTVQASSVRRRAAHRRGDRQTIRCGERLHRPAKTLGGRAHYQLAQSLPQTGKGLGVSEPFSFGVSAMGLSSPHAAKAMSNNKMISDRLSTKTTRTSQIHDLNCRAARPRR
jgi:hypothetical protein